LALPSGLGQDIESQNPIFALLRRDALPRVRRAPLTVATVFKELLGWLNATLRAEKIRHDSLRSAFGTYSVPRLTELGETRFWRIDPALADAYESSLASNNIGWVEVKSLLAGQADVLQLCSRAKVGVDDRKFSLSQ